MKTKFTLLALLISIVAVAQNGINYKAVMKNDLGNVIANSSIVIKFQILESDVLINIYEETHAPTTDTNGIIIVNIGTGTTISGIFNAINWEGNEHFLNVKIDTGSGFVDMGTTQFSAVPYAFHAQKAANVKGLEALDEGNGIGWRLVGRNTSNYDNIGFNAIDLSSVNDPNLGLGATGNYAFSLGRNGTASGEHSLAFGNQNYALNNYAIAIGNNNNVTGLNSTAIGGINQVSGDYAFAAGLQNEASNDFSIAIGQQTTATGYSAIALGSLAQSSGNHAIAIGVLTEASGDYSTAIGRNSIASGDNATALGAFSIASENLSTAMGTHTEASGIISTTMGHHTEASGYVSTAMGSYTKALADYSTAIGGDTEALGNYSIAMGLHTEASGHSSITAGSNTQASGSFSFAMGSQTIASGRSSSAMGSQTIASSYAETSIGSYNTIYTPNSDIDWNSNDRLFVIGNGNSENNRSNAITILKNGYTGIGTSSPQELLHISGGRLRIGSETIEDTGNNRLSFNADLLPDVDNAMQLGNSSFQWQGLWATDGTINTSDRRSKTNIVSLNYGLEDILKLNPVSFNWKTNPNDDTKLGLIAQDLIKVIPEVVKTHDWETDEDGTKIKKELERMGVYYSDLIPVLINAIQEQQKIITTQRDENLIQTLELNSINDTLQTLMSRIELLESNTSN